MRATGAFGQRLCMPLARRLSAANGIFRILRNWWLLHIWQNPSALSAQLQFALLRLHHLSFACRVAILLRNCSAAHFALERCDHSLQRHLLACKWPRAPSGMLRRGPTAQHTSAHTQRQTTQSIIIHLQHLSRRQQQMAASHDVAVHWLAAASAPQPAAAGWLPQTRWPALGAHFV